MKFIPVLYQRDFSAPRNVGVRLEATNVTWKAVGGSDVAVIEATGSRREIYELVEALRCPVVLRGEAYRAAWWGFVSRVEITDGPLAIGVSLDKMANRVRVSYSDAVGAGVTAWADDAPSQAAYGIKDKSISYYDLTAVTAAQIRDQELARYRYPIPVTDPGRSRRRASMGRVVSATLTCRGWWLTLDWRTAEVAAVSALSYTSSVGWAVVGGADYNLEQAQQITIGASDVRALCLKIYCAAVGSPQDELLVGIYELDGDGNPEGASVATGAIYGPLLSSTPGWAEIWYSETLLAASRQYGLRFSRSGEVDAANYYNVGIGTAAFSGGVMKTFGGTTWATASGYTILFDLLENQQVATTTQISSLVTTYGQFLTATDLESASGITRGSYQDGDNTVLRVIDDLLAIGKANGRRYLAEVTEARRLRVYEEPASTSVPFRFGRDRVLRTAQGQAVEPGMNPVGQWCRLEEALPGSVDITRLGDPTLQFIEGADWTPETGLQPVFLGDAALEDLLRVA